jgi:hypothetical protein
LHHGVAGAGRTESIRAFDEQIKRLAAAERARDLLEPDVGFGAGIHENGPAEEAYFSAA